ncbi:cell wall hydrolase [Paenibacillus sp. JX-17]|uniref:Cell wall hydrolase n=1 Tax=Paenibacillus lacisoli TaxID=3064525 RepID=A0ABT9CG86_9BACL|nr:cell wall hydrolase [Paenibacillus sp. JX-17]MDO7908294.1 cell wall hydrolase [Paenibacillus sp. JX-17]
MKKLPALIASLTCAAGLAFAAAPAQAQTLQTGMKNNEVAQLQRELHARGYFEAGFTGYYGSITTGAVTRFQQDHGLAIDGIAGPATQAKLNGSHSESAQTAVSKVRYQASQQELNDLARIIYAEARGESLEGQIAVGAVVLNRLESGLFPRSISEIILQPGQFTAVDDGQYQLAPNRKAYRAARAALNGADPTNGSLFYYNPQLATSEWSKNRQAVVTVGRHIFTN